MPVFNEIGKTKIEVRVKVLVKLINNFIKIKSIFEKNIFATSVLMKIPVPKNTANVTSNTAIGRAKY